MPADKPCDIKGDDGAYHCPYVEEKPSSDLCKEKCNVDVDEDPCSDEVY